MRGWLILAVDVGLIVATAGCGETQGQRAATGSLGGIAFGTAVAGPIGAVIGGAAGALAGAERGNIDRLVNSASTPVENLIDINNPANKASSTAGAAPARAEPTAMAPARAPAPTTATAPPRRSAASREDIRDAQQRLEQLGLYRGPIDGLNGPQTAAALNNFQALNGLPMGGQLTRATQQQLQSQTSPSQEQQPANGSPTNQRTAPPRPEEAPVPPPAR